MSRNQSIKGPNMTKDQKSKESDEISNTPLSQLAWRNTYARIRRSYKSNYTTMALGTNAHICMHVDEYFK